MMLSPELETVVNALGGADLIRRPECYSSRSDKEWDAICVQALSELERMAREDGCVAAAWALAMFEAHGKDDE